jgi:hypothetical protein
MITDDPPFADEDNQNYKIKTALIDYVKTVTTHPSTAKALPTEVTYSIPLLLAYSTS